MIQFDFSKCGLDQKELDATAPALLRAHQALEKEKSLGEIGWWQLPTQPAVKNISKRFDNWVVLGIGGSSQGAKALVEALLPPQPTAKLFVLESPDPVSVGHLLANIDLSRTGFNVVSKSGESVETLALFDYFQKLVESQVGSKWREHFVVTTGKGKGKLFALAEKEKLCLLEVPENVGGRFSVFSAVGLFPFACAGGDVEGLLKGAQNALKRCSVSNVDENPAYKNGAAHFLLNKNHGKTISVMIPYGDALKEFGGWTAQLWAESLGKGGEGQTPLVAVGPQAQHWLGQLLLDGPKDKVVTFVTVEAGKKNPFGPLLKQEQVAFAKALEEVGCPSITLSLSRLDAETVGELLMTYQVQTAFTGHLMGVNPYNQPAVERIKKLL